MESVRAASRKIPLLGKLFEIWLAQCPSRFGKRVFEVEAFEVKAWQAMIHRTLETVIFKVSGKLCIF